MGTKKKVKKAARAEHELTKSVAKLHDRPAVQALGGVSNLADQPPLALIGAATLAAGLLLRRRDIARAGARMLIAHAIGTGAKSLLKGAVDRSRPTRALADGAARVDTRASSADDTDFNSFPSGHTTGAVGAAQAVAHELPAIALPARAAAAAVGIFQVPRGAHYLSDVAAGAAVGWAAEWIAGALLDLGGALVQRTRQVPRAGGTLDEAQAHPS